MPTCFVVMGFGEKTDLATGRKLNLDMTYRNVIKPAIESAGYKCIRADEVRHSGVIDIPMYDMLLNAELVVVDLSTSNLNATFELGVRHALKPRSTIIIAEKQFSSPFDVNHIAINRYEHLGPDIGFSEAMRMRQRLEELVQTMGTNGRPDSPVYSLIPSLLPPHIGTSSPSGAVPMVVGSALATVGPEESYAAHWAQAMDAKGKSDFERAKIILREIYNSQTVSVVGTQSRDPRPRVIQELALATYKSAERASSTGGPLVLEAGCQEALDLLRQLDPEHTVDPETIGLWSAVHKRLWKLESRTEQARRADLDAAIYASERGFLIRQDHYNGVNLAYLLDCRASTTRGDDRIVDRVTAGRVRRRVIDIASAHVAALEKGTETSEGQQSTELHDESFWLRASLAEALVGLSDPRGDRAVDDAKTHARAAWMIDTMLAQVQEVRRLRTILNEDLSS